jgi:predicted ATPase
MNQSKSVRLLFTKWATGTGWPKRLDWVEIEGLRGWNGQRVEFRSPIVAICGENGSGKSTVLQSAALAYYQHGDQTDWYPSDFLPGTPWDKLESSKIRYSFRQGTGPAITREIRKLPDRWVGTNDRPERSVKYVDMGRLQPMTIRTGYFRIAKPTVKEVSAKSLVQDVVSRISEIMGRVYSGGKMAVTDADTKRSVSVLASDGNEFSGFHQGAGELTVAELLQVAPTRNSLLLIDEIETSLHPRAQRRLMHDLANLCREYELQIILTTHSPYVLEELPPEARCYIHVTGGERTVLYGVSPEFAMTKMDDESYPECDLYVEDERAKVMLREVLMEHEPDIVSRVQIIPFGAAGVGQSLGMMVKQKRFVRPTIVFLDGDKPVPEGCLALPGGDAPERVVFEALRAKRWGLLDMRTGRDFSMIEDACARAMSISDEHEWVMSAARTMSIGGDVLWQILCATWATSCLAKTEAAKIIEPILEALISK